MLNRFRLYSLLIPWQFFQLAAQPLPDLKTASQFVVFSSVGVSANSGNSQYTGNIGSNTGTTIGFGNFDGQIHNGDAVSQQCATDINSAINQINANSCDSNVLLLTANNYTFRPGVYCALLSATMSGTITLDAGNDSEAVFIFNITGALTLDNGTSIQLKNGASSCRIFWVVGGLVNIGSNSTFHGNLIGTGTGVGAIIINSGVEIAGRVFATAGAISLNSVSALVPDGCGRPVLKGPVTPNLRSARCFALFTGFGSLTNSGTTKISGKIGTDSGTISGFITQDVSMGILNRDSNTNNCKIHVDLAYNYISSLPPDIQILFPSLFGNGLTLTPHVYLLNANTTLTDTLFLNARGFPNAVFVIKIAGNLTTASNSVIALQNGAKSCNIYWQVTGSTDFGNNSRFAGSILGNNSAILNNNVNLQGGMLTRSGDITTNQITASIPMECGGCPYSALNNKPYAANDSVTMLEDGEVISVNALFNDSDPDGDSLYINIVSHALNGISSLNNREIQYKPARNFNGRDTVLYRVCDPFLCDSAFVFIDVTPVRDTLIAMDDYATTPLNTPTVIDVIRNDSNPDNLVLTVTILEMPDSGTASLVSNNIRYQPFIDFLGFDTLYYKVCDNGTPVLCDSARVIVRVVESTTSDENDFYNGLSPNGDGYNDFWKIKLLNNYPENDVIIINRHGDIVWNQANYDNINRRFTGKNMNGEELPDGTYFYRIIFNGIEKQGWLILKR